MTSLENSSEHIEDLADVLSLLLQELDTMGEVLFDALQAIMEDLKTGRAPKTLGLEEKLQDLADYQKALDEIWQDYQENLQAAQSLSSDSGAQDETNPNQAELLALLPALEEEKVFWQQLSLKSSKLIQRLQGICDRDDLGPSGFISLEEIWQEIEALARKD